MKQNLRILVSGMLAGDPGQGGASWAVLQYLIGLMDLGHTVMLVEPISEKKLGEPRCTLPETRQAAYLHAVASHFGLQRKLSLIREESRETFGASFEELERFSRKCDLLINISGMLQVEELVTHIPVRVFLDLDPAFNQVWQSVYGINMHFHEHTHHITVGLGMGSVDCAIPGCGVAWQTTLPPVVLRMWPVSQTIRHNALTSVANLRGYGSVEFEGRHYGQKIHSLRDFYTLPTLTAERIALAMHVDPREQTDLRALNENGWVLLDPALHCGTPWGYQEFVRGSKGEFGIAKSGYVHSRSGWFSDRSACYLASGSPVLAQATGFENLLPVGEGLFAFRSLPEALAAIDSLNSRYESHARAARALAMEYLDSRKVLNGLLDKVGF